MNPRVALLLAAAALAGVLAWAMRDAGEPQRTGAGAPRANVASADERAPAATSAAAPAPEAQPTTPAHVPIAPAVRRSPRGTMSPAREAYEHAASLGTLFKALRGQADPDALYFAERALQDCASFLVGAQKPGEATAIDRYRPLASGRSLAARRKAAYDALAARCSGFDVDDANAAQKALFEARLAANDPRAMLQAKARELARGTDPADAMSSARALVAGGDPYVLDEAGRAIGALRGRYVFMLDGQLVRPDIASLGWMMAACDAGLECGAPAVEPPCAFLGECDAPDVESALARYQLAPADFERVQLVRTRIAQGVATGQWDDALFTPQAQPPWYRRNRP